MMRFVAAGSPRLVDATAVKHRSLATVGGMPLAQFARLRRIERPDAVRQASDTREREERVEPLLVGVEEALLVARAGGHLGHLGGDRMPAIPGEAIHAGSQ